MKLKIALIALGCSLAALSGCTSSKSSPERHAYYFVSHRSDFVGGTAGVAFAHPRLSVLLAAGIDVGKVRQI